MPIWPDPLSAAGDVIACVRGHVGLIGLNRPHALNALTIETVRAIAGALDRFESNPQVAHVAVLSTGGRAFCAGGDIRVLGEHIGRGDFAAALGFWAEEYRLNRRIKHYSKPYIALIDGIVMGGGVGISVHGAWRIATERYAFAMPEVGIGFIPDVGATFVLPRCPGKSGWYLALTGLRADCGDAVALGLASCYMPSERVDTLLAALAQSRDTAALVRAFATPPPDSPLAKERALIDSCCSAGTLPTILASFQKAAAAGSHFAAAAVTALVSKSPMSLQIALRQMQIGAGLEFDAALQTEYRIVSRLCRGHDFSEGIRAVIIDKDNCPQWQPATLAAVEEGAIAAHFAPLDGAGGELSLTVGQGVPDEQDLARTQP
jgi:enoyl-CoA hydratase